MPKVVERASNLYSFSSHIRRRMKIKCVLDSPSSNTKAEGEEGGGGGKGQGRDASEKCRDRAKFSNPDFEPRQIRVI